MQPDVPLIEGGEDDFQLVGIVIGRLGNVNGVNGPVPATSTKQPSLNGVTAASKTPPPIRTLFSRLKRGPDPGRERTSLCLSHSAGRDTSSDHGLPIERGAGGWNRRVSGVLLPGAHDSPRFRAGRLSPYRLPHFAAHLQTRSWSPCERGHTSKATGIGRAPSSRDRPANRRDRNPDGLRRPPDVPSRYPPGVWPLTISHPEGWPVLPLAGWAEGGYYPVNRHTQK
jgi:hypothetical protein